jgi:NAD(P)-dependent dehydrogenase (short-subunit alcohol dehydrogenase family)
LSPAGRNARAGRLGGGLRGRRDDARRAAEQRRRSEYDRPETIEETAELVDQVGGHGIAVSVDHLDPGEVRSLVGRIEEEQGRLDVLVNDVWGGEHLIEWNVPVWEHSLEGDSGC